MKKICCWVAMGIIFLLASLPVAAKAETFKIEGDLVKIAVDKDTDNALLIVNIDGKEQFFQLAGPNARVSYWIGNTYMMSEVKDGLVWGLPAGHINMSATGEKKKIDDWEYYYCSEVSLSYSSIKEPVE